MRRVAPALRADAIAGAVAFSDTQVDDARHTLTLARTAAAYPAGNPPAALAAKRALDTEHDAELEECVVARCGEGVHLDCGSHRT